MYGPRSGLRQTQPFEGKLRLTDRPFFSRNSNDSHSQPGMKRRANLSFWPAKTHIGNFTRKKKKRDLKREIDRLPRPLVADEQVMKNFSLHCTPPSTNQHPKNSFSFFQIDFFLSLQLLFTLDRMK
ncbi:hypothetical protein AVEN_96044-1 [Araneus ventricosus]|uniref:Uncharacterized protein n=1 Tax=Araneus ventricosus TaxID=182803 RepID=A0A4Y2B3P4_ARAVE|nr:hypothetical protein AVEN_96044-1 [Araneus ventricosus]